MPITTKTINSTSYTCKNKKKGSGTSYFLLSVLAVFPLFLQAKSNVNTVELQLKNHIFTLISKWQIANNVDQIKPKLELKSSRKVEALNVCDKPIKFNKKSDKLLGIQQWTATCVSTNQSAMIRSQLSIKALLPVAFETLSRGHVITANDITEQWVTYPQSQIRVISHQSQILNKRIKRKVRRLKPILAKQLISNIWISAGEQVIIEANSKGFSANMKGEALQSGGEGQAIKVKNLSSGAVILAYPISRGKVETRF